MEQILYEETQGSVLGPILCNIFLSVSDLFLNNVDIVSSADDNTLYKVFYNVDAVVETENISRIAT